MYAAGLGAKIVSMRAPVQAAAGLEELGSELAVGELGPCGNLATGSPCRGFEAGGVLARCICVNLQNEDTVAEVKQLLSDASGAAVSRSIVWTAADQQVLADWAESLAGVHAPDVRHPWRSGIVTVAELLQRTEIGDIYPTGQGILALLDGAGCMPDEATVCPSFPVLTGAIDALREGAGALNELDSIKVYPPYFGETSGTQQIQPGQSPPAGAELFVDLGLKQSSHWLGWAATLLGATVAGVWLVSRG